MGTSFARHRHGHVSSWNLKPAGGVSALAMAFSGRSHRDPLAVPIHHWVAMISKTGCAQNQSTTNTTHNAPAPRERRGRCLLGAIPVGDLLHFAVRVVHRDSHAGQLQACRTSVGGVADGPSTCSIGTPRSERRPFAAPSPCRRAGCMIWSRWSVGLQDRYALGVAFRPVRVPGRAMI